MRPLPSREDVQARLGFIFPREAFDPVLSNPLAAAALVAMLYVDAIVPDTGDLGPDAIWARPSLCLWMRNDVYARDTVDERTAWRQAALSGRARHAVAELHESWGLPRSDPWYADNTRETLRDETFPAWLDYGAMRDRPGLPTTSGRPRWALSAGFADLFNPSLTGDEFEQQVEAWRASRMTPGDRLRIATLRERDHFAHGVPVTLPGGTVRQLEPGDASRILRGVIEQWARARLRDPVVLCISEPGDKVYVADAARLRALGLALDSGNVLPDAVVVDIATTPPTFWIIEAVASDGPVTEDRRRQLLRWAYDQRIPTDSCRFLSAFLDRNDPAAKRRLKDLAVGSFAWFLAEPSAELAWYEIPDEE